MEVFTCCFENIYHHLIIGPKQLRKTVNECMEGYLFYVYIHYVCLYKGQHCANGQSKSTQVIDSLHGGCFPFEALFTITADHNKLFLYIAVFDPADGGCNLWEVYVSAVLVHLAGGEPGLIVVASLHGKAMLCTRSKISLLLDKSEQSGNLY